MKKPSSVRSVGSEIIAGLEEALSYERGELTGVKVTRRTLSSQRVVVAPAPGCPANRIARLRAQLKLSQPVFAAALNVSAETVKKWEQGTREPEGAALRLLELAELHPQWIVDQMRSAAATKTSGGPDSRRHGSTRKAIRYSRQ